MGVCLGRKRSVISALHDLADGLDTRLAYSRTQRLAAVSLLLQAGGIHTTCGAKCDAKLRAAVLKICLLYTSDAADDYLTV